MPFERARRAELNDTKIRDRSQLWTEIQCSKWSEPIYISKSKYISKGTHKTDADKDLSNQTPTSILTRQTPIT